MNLNLVYSFYLRQQTDFEIISINYSNPFQNLDLGLQYFSVLVYFVSLDGSFHVELVDA